MSDRDIIGTLTNEPSITGQFEPDIIIKGTMEARFPANVYVISPIQLDRNGGNYTFSLDLNEVIANLPPSGVASVFGRTGDVTAQSGDYTFAQIGSKPTTLSGYGITDAQPLDSDLTAIAALSTTSYGRAFLALADAAAARTAVGLGNVDNTSDANKPVSTATQTALNLKANLASPTFTGTPAAPTPSFNDNTTKIGTTAFFFNQVSNATPLGAAAVAAAGTSTLWARADHVHPGREVLTASRTYYFRSDGSDSNTGLVNSAGGAFLTIQKAIDTVAGLDCSIYDVTIQGGATGTYAPITLKTFLGSGKVTIVGDTTTPANYVIASTSADGVGGSNVLGRYKIEGFKFTNATYGSHIKLYNTYLEVGANDYGAATTAHIWLEQNAYVEATANYTISGGASRHLFATTGGVFVCSAKTITLTGTPAFSSATIIASRTGVFNLPGNTYSGAATGTRYIISYNAVADVAGGGATYLPGNAGGIATTGGQYA